MDNLKKIWSWLLTLPLWLRSVILILSAVLAILLSVSSCGTPKTVATVQNVNPNSTVTVSMSVSNSTTNTTDVPPTINFTK